MAMRAVCEMGDMIKGAIPFAGGLAIANSTLDILAGTPPVKYPLNDSFLILYEKTPWLIKSDIDKFNPNLSEKDFFSLPKFFNCDKARNTHMMFINGYDDKTLDVRGEVCWNFTSTPN